MGKLNDKMTALADALRNTSILPFSGKLSIDDMIEFVGDLHYWEPYLFGTASPEDVSIGKTFYNDDILIERTGTMPDTAASVDKNIITIPAGRIREDTTVTIPAGSVAVANGTVSIVPGYIEEQTIDNPSFQG